MLYSEINTPLILVSLITAIVISCSNPSDQKANDNKRWADAFSVDTISLIYFHQKKGCKTCRAISEALNRAAVRFKGTKVGVYEIDINSPKGKVLAEKFNISFAGLIVYHQSGEHYYYTNLTTEAFRLATNNADSLDRIIEKTVSLYNYKKKE